MNNDMNTDNGLEALLGLIFYIKNTNLKRVVNSLNLSSYENILRKLKEGTLRVNELEAILNYLNVELVFRDKITKREY